MTGFEFRACAVCARAGDSSAIPFNGNPLGGRSLVNPAANRSARYDRCMGAGTKLPFVEV